MRKRLAIGVLSLIASLTLGIGPTWALFESNQDLADSAKITMAQALSTAEKTIPGKSIKAEMGKDEGRVVYEVKILDANKKTHWVYVDAQNGKVMEKK